MTDDLPVFSRHGSPLPPDRALPYIAEHAAMHTTTKNDAAELTGRMFARQFLAWSASWDLGITARIHLDHAARGEIWIDAPRPSVTLPVVALPEGVSHPRGVPVALLKLLGSPAQPSDPPPPVAAAAE